VLTLISVATTSTAGGTINDNLDGTFTYTPPGGFSGADTLTYSVADGYIPAVTGTVNVTVESPQTDTLTIQKAIYEAGPLEWRIRGTSSIVGPGNSVTIYLGRTIGTPTVIGTVQVDALGDWEFRQSNSPTLPGSETTVSAFSSYRGIVEGFPIQFK